MANPSDGYLVPGCVIWPSPAYGMGLMAGAVELCAQGAHNILVMIK